MFRRLCKRLLTPPMILIAALVMFVEEWIWDRLAAFMSWLGQAPVLRRAERRIAALPPYPAMGVFLMPSLLLLPVNIFAVYLTAQGQAVAGSVILIAAKLAGTAVVARLFTLCRPSLLTVNWFRAVYEWIGRLKKRLYNSSPWLAAVRWKNRLKARVARLFRRYRSGPLKRRWRAILHIKRRKAKAHTIGGTAPVAAAPTAAEPPVAPESSSTGTPLPPS